MLESQDFYRMDILVKKGYKFKYIQNFRKVSEYDKKQIKSHKWRFSENKPINAEDSYLIIEPNGDFYKVDVRMLHKFLKETTGL